MLKWTKKCLLVRDNYIKNWKSSENLGSDFIFTRSNDYLAVKFKKLLNVKKYNQKVSEKFNQNTVSSY